MRESERTARLMDEVGPSGLSSQPNQTTNKRFLANTMRSVINHNHRQSTEMHDKSRHKYEELKRLTPKFGARLHSFQRHDERLTKKDDL